MTSPKTKESRERIVAFPGRMKGAEGSNEIGHATLGTQYISFGSSTGVYLRNTSSGVESKLGADADLKISALPVCGTLSTGYPGIKFHLVRRGHSQMEQARERKATDEVQGMVTDPDSCSRWIY